MHRVKSISREISSNILRCLEEIDVDQIEKMLAEILEAKKLFVLGVGHSGLIGKILAMKLAHLGFCSYVVGDVTTPSFNKGDLLIAISQSGENSTILTLVKKARSLGGRVAAITSSPQSTLSKLSDICMLVAARGAGIEFPVLSLIGDGEHSNLSGALFSMNIFALFYGMICELIVRTNQSWRDIDSRHANIQ